MAARLKRPEVIQRVMRHAKVSITIDRYVKVYRETVRAALFLLLGFAAILVVSVANALW